MAARAKKPTPEPAPRPMAKAAEVAEYLQTSEQTLANWRWQGKGPRYYGKGRGVLYDWADVNEWLKGQAGGEGVRRGAA